MKVIVTLSLTTLIAFAAWAKTDVQIPLDDLKGRFESAISKIEAAHELNVASSLSKYLAALTDLEDTRARAGDLDGVLVARHEAERVKAGAAPANGKDLADVLRPARRTHYASLLESRSTRDRRLSGLVEDYVAHLADLKANLVRRDEIKDAVAVRDEIGRAVTLIDERTKMATAATGPHEQGPALPNALQAGLAIRYGGAQTDAKRAGAPAPAERVDLPQATLDGDFTIAAWVRTGPAMSDREMIGWDDPKRDVVIRLGILDARFHVRLNEYSFCGGTPDRGWQHISVVARRHADSRTTLSLYVNGTREWTTTMSTSIASAGRPWVVADRRTTGVQTLTIHRRALSENDVRLLYKSVAGRHAPT